MNRQPNKITFMVAVRTKRTRAAKTFKELMQVSGKSVTSIVFLSWSIWASRSSDLSVVVKKVVEVADEVVVVVGKKVSEGVEVVVRRVVGLFKAKGERFVSRYIVNAIYCIIWKYRDIAIFRKYRDILTIFSVSDNGQF